MDAKINIAKILKDKPEGTKLWTDMFGSVTLYVVTDACDAFQVKHHNKEPWFDKDGKLYKEGVLCIYPSKSMRDWEKFSWKKGDVLVSNDGKERVIFEKFQDNRYLRFFGKFFSQRKEDGDIDYKFALDAPTNNYTLEDKDVAQIYINTIEERLGGKLNRQTLEVEKALPEFKDGDIVFAESHMLGINTSSMIAIFRKEKEIDKYKFSPALCESNEHDTYLREGPVVLSPSDIKIFRYATDSEKQQLFDALAKENKDWDSEHKMIVDLKPKVELKPFDKVLVRDNKDQKWKASFFGYKDENHFMCENGCAWFHCIPYEGNEHLLGTTKDVEG